jgi:hypothetical protein
VVGVTLFESGDDSARLDHLEAYLPGRPPDKYLCLQVLSQDGRYEGHGAIEVLAGGGFEPLGLDGRHAENLTQYPRRAVAVRAEFKANCASPDPGVLVPVGMSAHSREASDLKVFVNSLDADVQARLVDSTGADAKWTTCTAPKSGESQVAFDRVCSLATGARPAGRRTLEVEVTGWTGARTLFETEIEIPGR